MRNNTTLKPKVSIIGCGNVGMRYAYALAMQGLVRSLVITDLDRKRLEGEVMDMSHGAPYVSPIEIAAGDYSDINGVRENLKIELSALEQDQLRHSAEKIKGIIKQVGL
jgi:L-lactate dehydrogenase